MESFVISVGARGSKLSRVQVQEVLNELRQYHPEVQFDVNYFTTTGDQDLKTSLRTLPFSNFFTKELDDAQIQGKFRISIHSAKDLPQPLPVELICVALTKGVDSRDALVMQEGYTLKTLPPNAKIGSSSFRRDEAVRKLRPDVTFIDIRGPIDMRLDALFSRKVDALVIAEAALLRLKLPLNRILLEDETAPNQGRLAVLARKDDHEMKTLFSCIHAN